MKNPDFDLQFLLFQIQILTNYPKNTFISSLWVQIVIINQRLTDALINVSLEHKKVESSSIPALTLILKYKI